MKRPILAVLVLIIAGGLLAQGTSALKATDLQITPSPFKEGDTLTFKANIKNTGTEASGRYGYTVFLTVWANDVCVTQTTPAGCKQVWNTSVQMNGQVASGAAALVTFPGSVRITEAASKYCFTVCAIDPPNEFCDTYKVCANASCTYSLLKKFVPIKGLISKIQGNSVVIQGEGASPARPVKMKPEFPKK